MVNSLKDKNLDITKNPHLANEAKYICDRFKWQECDVNYDGVTCPLFVNYGNCLLNNR